MDFSEKLPRYAFFGFNAVYMAGCISIIVIAAIIQYTLFYYDFFPESSLAPGRILFVSSSFLLIAGIAGYFGAIKGKNVLIYIFIGFAAVCAILQLTGGCMALNQEKAIEIEMLEELQSTQALYAMGGTDQETQDAVKHWNYLQEEFHCCGVNKSNEWLTLGMASIPQSCTCKGDKFPCETIGNQTVYKNGCYEELRDYVHPLMVILGCFAITFFAVLLFSIALAHMLTKNINMTTSVA